MRKLTINWIIVDQEKKNKGKDEIALIENKKFRRPNKAVALRVSGGGTLTLLCRKIFNVMLYHTQKLGVPGANAPSDQPRFQKYYWVPLSVFVEDARFNSEAVDYLSESFNNLLNIKLHCDDEGGMGSESLLAGFRITNKSGKRGDPRWVGWALPPSVEEMAMNPLLYTTASLYYLTSLKSSHALGLYEIAKRYATSPGGLTMRKPVEWWHEQLRGVPVGTEMSEYKIFKRDILKPSIVEVNLLTDVEVELVEIKSGRKVVELQFKVGEKKQGQLELPPSPVLDIKTIERLALLGFSQREAEDIFAANEPSFVKVTIEFVEARIANTSLPPIDSGAAFFRAAMKNRYAETAANAKNAAAKKKISDKALEQKEVIATDPAKEAARAEALRSFDALDASSREALLNQLAAKNPLLSKSIRKNPNGKAARVTIASWLIEHPLSKDGVPTAQD